MKKLGTSNKGVMKLLALGALVVIFIFGGYIIAKQIIQSEKVKTGYQIYAPCINTSTGLTESATKALVVPNDKRSEDIKTVVDEVIKYDNHQSDLHCMQLITIRNIEEGNYTEARKSLDAVNSLVSSEDITPLGQGENFIPVENMVKAVELLGKMNNEIKKNDPYGNQGRLNEKQQ